MAMKLIVNGRVEEVIDTWDHGGNTYARVESGFVEVPPNPTEPHYTIRCEECGTTMHLGGEERLVGVKEHTVPHESSAVALARIHEIKTGHSADIIETAP